MSTSTASPATAPSANSNTAEGALDALRDARRLAEAGDAAAAGGRINDALQRWPDHAPWLVCVAGALRDGRTPEEEKEFADLIQTPGAAARMYAPAAAAVSGLAKLPVVGTALGIRSALSVDGDNHREAVDRLLALFAATPAASLPKVAPRIAIQLALHLDEQGMSGAAHDVATFAQRRWSGSVALRTVAARFLVQERRWSKLAAMLEPVLKSAPNNRMARGYEALAALADGRLAECAAKLDQYGIPHDSAFLAELALLIAPYDDRFGKKVGDLPEKIEMPTDKGAAMVLNRAEKLLQRENIEEGLAALEDDKVAPRSSVSERPTVDQALWLRLHGYAFYKLKRFDEAALNFAAAAAADPHDPWYVSGAGQALLFRGDAESAATCLRQVLPVGPDDFGAFFHLGLAYGQLGRLGDARRTLRAGFREFFVDTMEISLQPMVRSILGAAAEKAFSETVRM